VAQKFITPITIKNLASAGSDALTVFLDGEVYGRVKLEAGGRLSWSDGTGTYDTNLYRDSANTLTTDDVFKASAGVVTLAINAVPTASLPDGALAIDTLNDAFYFRSKGAWVQVSAGGLSTSDLDGGNQLDDILEAEVTNQVIAVYDGKGA
jgi:hypothetical protein